MPTPPPASDADLDAVVDRLARPVVVTGAGGFLGRRVVDLLTSRGVPVRGVAAPGESLAGVGAPGGAPVEAVTADLTDPGAVAAALDGAGTVLHLAAMYVFGPRHPEQMWAVNVGGARNVLAAVAGTDAVVVHVSSASALGRTGTTPAPDDHWGPLVDPINYELTKREAHLRMLEAAAGGAHVRVAAPTAIYGPGDPSITGELLTLIATRALPAIGPSDVVQCPVYVDDCAEALVRIAADGTDGCTYPVAGDPVSMGDWVELTARLAGHRPPRRVPSSVVRRVAPLTFLAPLAGRTRAAAREMLAVGCASFAYRADRLRALGWVPRPLEAGMRVTVEAARADRPG